MRCENCIITIICSFLIVHVAAADEKVQKSGECEIYEFGRVPMQTDLNLT